MSSSKRFYQGLGITAGMAAILSFLCNDASSAPRNLITPTTQGGTSNATFPQGRGVVYPQVVPQNQNNGGGAAGMSGSGPSFSSVTSLGSYPISGPVTMNTNGSNNNNGGNLLGLLPLFPLFNPLFNPLLNPLGIGGVGGVGGGIGGIGGVGGLPIGGGVGGIGGIGGKLGGLNGLYGGY